MNLCYIGLIWLFFSFFFFAGGSDKAVPVLRLEGQKVGDELPFLYSIFYFNPWAVFFDFEC